MPLVNLGGLTRSLLSLISNGIFELDEWNMPNPPEVTALPADQAAGMNALSFYLYHAVEDPHFKNQVAPVRDANPVRLTPMGLQLYYQLSTHSADATSDETIEAQRRFGLALKVLHDHPKVDDQTSLAGHMILSDGGIDSAGNRLTIDLQPVQWDEAIQYWIAGKSSSRLAAYYKVSVVFLEPEEPQRRTGRVLNVGLHTFVGGAPHIEHTKSQIRIRPPGTTEDQILEARPALVEVDQSFHLVGGELSGDDVQIEIRAPGGARHTLGGGSWRRRGEREVLSTFIPPFALAGPVVPGLYGVRVVRHEQRGGRPILHGSNEVPVTVVPRVAEPISGPTAGGRFTAIGGPFGPTAVVDPDAVEVHVGSEMLTRKVAAGNTVAGEFQILDATRVRFTPPVGLSTGEHVVVRILVNGAEAAPHWIEIP